MSVENALLRLPGDESELGKLLQDALATEEIVNRRC